MNDFLATFASAVLLALPLALTAPPAQIVRLDPMHASVPMCTANQLSLATDQENGAFDGMSHSGTLVVLRNLGPAACRFEPYPKITFLDGSKTLPATGSIPGTRFMHPGPVVLAVVVAAGAELTSSLRWVSGEVYDRSVCIEPKAMAVAIGTGKQQVAFAAHLCGDAAKGITYEMTRFATDPVYTGK